NADPNPVIPPAMVSQPILAPGDLHFYNVSATSGYLGTRFVAAQDFAPMLTVWDPGGHRVVARSRFGLIDSLVASTVGPVASATELWVVVDHFATTGALLQGMPAQPSYQLDIEQPPAATNDTCAAPQAFSDPGVPEIRPNVKEFTGWTAATNDVTLRSQPSP